MRYYLIKSDSQFFLKPNLIHWFDKMNNGKYSDIPNRLLLQIKDNPKTIFTKIIIDPVFLVMEEIKDCLSQYEPTLYFKEVVLLDKQNKQVQEYFLPMLEGVDCLTSNCKYSFNYSHLLNIEVSLDKIKDKTIFYLSGISPKYVIVRLDVAESIIRRGASGFLLEEVNCR